MLRAHWMPEIALEPRPGDSLGPYRIRRVIGRGRMGIVFERTADGEDPVAVKVVTTELSQKEPEDRPASAGTFVAGIARAAGQ